MQRNDYRQKKIKNVLAKNPACYVLIACEEPTEEGFMQVEMIYEGDADMAAYLIQGAHSYIQDPEQAPKIQSKKIVPFLQS